MNDFQRAAQAERTKREQLLANTNGDLPEHRQKQVEAGLAQYQAVSAERDLLQRDLREMTLKYEGEVMKLGQMQSLVNMLESTIQTHQLQRDEAVTAAAALREAFDTICLIAAKHAPMEPPQ